MSHVERDLCSASLRRRSEARGAYVADVVVVRTILGVLLVTSSVAHADARLGAHVGGGLEGGLITGKPRPDVYGEIGVAADWIPDGRTMGFGVIWDRVERPPDVESEHTLDLEARIRAKHDARIGIGMGIRWLDPGHGDPSWFGYDWIRMDAVLPAARSTHASVDFYFHWSFGCYVSNSEAMPERPQLAPRDVHCGDTITTSYVLGIQLSAY